MEKAILIIDDDTRLIELLTKYLGQLGLKVLSATHPDVGLQLLRRESPSLVILDVMLPEKNGFEVCKEIRRDSRVPVIMLTARGDVTDKIVGLELGADDYLAKPFEPRELFARIQSVLRRAPESPNSTAPAKLEFEELVIDTNRRSATLAGKPVELTTMEYETLLLFATNPGKVLSRDELMERLRGIDWEAYNRSIDVVMSRLRQKLGDNPKRPTYFKTVWGTGYMFIAGRVEEEGRAR